MENLEKTCHAEELNGRLHVCWEIHERRGSNEDFHPQVSSEQKKARRWNARLGFRGTMKWGGCYERKSEQLIKHMSGVVGGVFWVNFP